MNLLRSKLLPNTDFRNPSQVLERLNATFKMEQHDDRYFTIWYGVFSTRTRQLVYAGAGHPPALLLPPIRSKSEDLRRLESAGAAIGWGLDMPYEASCVSLDAGARLLVYSDGVFEIEKSDGSNWAFDEFVRFVVGAQGQSQCADQLLAEVRQLHGSDTLADDFSMLEVVF